MNCVDLDSKRGIVVVSLSNAEEVDHCPCHGLGLPKRGFNIGDRVMRFLIFDMTLFTSLPATAKQNELGMLVRESMAKYVEDKQVKLIKEKENKKPRVFRRYIKVMKFRQANRVQKHIIIYHDDNEPVIFLLGYVWSSTMYTKMHDKKRFLTIAYWDKVDHGSQYDVFKLFADIKDLEGVLSYEERLCRKGEVASEAGMHAAALNQVDFWHSGAMDLEDRL
ncbi:hypothetical protein Cgig2_020176 [Carnegiea gigantea]|uniref:Uncharacterized protein n=1 Tax=Carnegiea gigantea TaxID=171969 RepID=A0A9Q1QQL3_9CARY|nr:hypothetical protein Cgig2_020176 [Carnegiea gigantea]